MTKILNILGILVFTFFSAVSLAYAMSGDKEAGKALFEKHCIQCHGIGGDADTKLGHLLSTPPANFTDPNYKDSRGKRLSAYSDDELSNKIKYGSKGTAMPSWKSKLSDADIADLLSYVRSLESSTTSSK